MREGGDERTSGGAAADAGRMFDTRIEEAVNFEMKVLLFVTDDGVVKL